MLTYQLEPWAQYYADVQELWAVHYAEFEPFHQGRMPMAPDVDLYAALERAGQLMVLVVRNAGVVVGYSLMVVKPHPHYRYTLCGFEDSYYLHPDFRKGFAGIRLVRETLKHVRARGAKMVYIYTKDFASKAKLLKFCGMTKCDEVYCLWMGD